MLPKAVLAAPAVLYDDRALLTTEPALHNDLIQLYEAPADGLYHFKNPHLGVASFYGDAITMWCTYDDGRVMLVWTGKRSGCTDDDLRRRMRQKRIDVALVGDGSSIPEISDVKVISDRFDPDANTRVALRILRAKKVSAPGNWYGDQWLFRDWAVMGVDALEFGWAARSDAAISAHAALAYLNNTGLVRV